MSDSAIDVARSCIGKQRYTTEAIAHSVAAKCFAARGTWLRVYTCESCGAFHLTKTHAVPTNQNWAPPKKSQRQLAYEAKQRRRRR